jgi:disulfide bond formation protein DsbB
MLETLPFAEVLSTVFKGSGECAKIDWSFLELSMPGWTFVFFVSIVVAALVLTRRS